MLKTNRRYLVHLLVLCCIAFILSTTSEKTETSSTSVLLAISIDHEISNGEVFITGKSNLPKGMSLGITLSNPDISYSAQDYSIIVDKNGDFKSAGFTLGGKQLHGSFNAELIGPINDNWQSPEMLLLLKAYYGKEIKDSIPAFLGDSIEVNYTVNAGRISLENSHLFEANEKTAAFIQNFCYAFQASFSCDNLYMRSDTEGKIAAELGHKVKGPGTKYNKRCMAGLVEALDDKNDGLCQNAWKRYGCFGNDIPKLIQGSPFSNDDGVSCKYE